MIRVGSVPSEPQGEIRSHGSLGLKLTLSFIVAVLVTPAHAQGISGPGATAAFDGTYVGVSAENNSAGNTLGGGREHPSGYAGSRSCRTFRAPARLIIANGVAQAKWGDYTLRGNPTPQGKLTMTTGYGQKFEGQIDSQQTIKGQLIGYCAYTLVWRKI